MHKSQKNLITDRENFIQFLHVIFPQAMLEEEILIMPEGQEGYGMFDFSHLKMFWTLVQKKTENSHLSEVQNM